MTRIQLESWNGTKGFEAAIAAVNELYVSGKQYRKRSMHVPLFRGLANGEWGLATTLDRAYPLELSTEAVDLATYYQNAMAARPAIETFSGQDWGDMPEPPEFSKELADFKSNGPQMLFNKHPSIYRYFVYLRHHGYPSPLLDWTASPYIAAFFAFDGMASTATFVSVIAIVRDTMITFGGDRPRITILGPYVRSHPRHMVQQSRYSICTEQSDHFRFRAHDEAIEMEGSLGTEGRSIRFDIPSSERRDALRSLDLMNINAYSLFGSDDSLIRTIARREGLLRGW